MAKQDGLRILTTRYRGRGLPGNRYDIWMANLGPSEKLLLDYPSQKSTWGEFGRCYRKELKQSFSSDKANRRIKNYGLKFKAYVAYAFYGLKMPVKKRKYKKTPIDD